MRVAVRTLRRRIRIVALGLTAAIVVAPAATYAATADPSRAPLPSPASASSSNRRDSPALPGLSRDVLASAERLQERDAEPESACAWCTPARVRRWAPVVGLVGVTLGVSLGPEPPDDPRWDTRNSFDDAIQDGLAGGGSSTREAAATASTVLISALGASFAADLYVLRDEYPLEQSLAVAFVSTGGTMLATETLKVSVGRERPYVRRCEADPGYSGSCNSGDDNASFASTHASESAALASQICARRLSRASVGWSDRLICGVAASASLATGLLRITADEHYFTDVLAGWGVGIAFGAVLPMMFPEWSGIGGERPVVTPTAGAGGFGLQYTSRF